VRIDLSSTFSTRVWQIHHPDTMQGSSTNDQMEWKLRNDKRSMIYIMMINIVNTDNDDNDVNVDEEEKDEENERVRLR